MTGIMQLDRVESPESTRPRGHEVTIRGARKSYGRTDALGGVDLEIEAGKFMVLLGPSGSGKSTLIRGIAGIERFDSGSISFGSTPISDDRHHVPAERRDLSMVFQDYALWPHLTVQQNVAYALRRRHLGTAARRANVLETLERVGLSSKVDNYPSELSGGQQQRVALARALVGSPALLLFDEPLSNLDADLRERLRVEISTLTRDSGATALYITHDQAEAFALADEIGVLNGGQLEQLGTPEEIFRRPATRFVAQFTGLAGAFAGRLVGERAGLSRARVGDHELSCTAGPGTSAGTRIDLLIRPTATSLVDRENPRRDAIPGVVVDVAYRGRGYEHVVETRYGRLASVFDPRSWSRGGECSIVIDPAGCVAFPATKHATT
jgi:ABC-type Fe3+/spermidine/putrescine transport system ATPase subunit